LTAQAYGASVDKRGLIGDIFQHLNPLNHNCQTGTGTTGAAPTAMKVDLDQLLQSDCEHPLSPNYKQTLRRLDVDLKDVKCVSNGVNQLTGLSLDAVFHPMELSCSGFHFRQIPYTFSAHFNGQQEDLTVDNCNQVVSSVNGNMFELNLGAITSGRCKGDLLYVQTVYTSDNPLACAEQTLNTLRITQMSAAIYGDNCPTECTDYTATPVTINPAINNQGKAEFGDQYLVID
ncbi:unnamed protein product, partial [Medioppia subpectinata]